MPGKGHKQQAPTVTASVALLEPSPVHWGDTIHFAVSGDGLFDVRVVVQAANGSPSVSFTTAANGWAVTLEPGPTFPAGEGGHATAELEGPPDDNGIQGAPLAITEFDVLP